MKEVKSPKKPLLYYYGITLLVILLFNLIVAPLMVRNQVTEVDYGTFMRMIEDGEIDKVQFDGSQIVFTGKTGDTVYTTGTMDDPTLTLNILGLVLGMMILDPWFSLLSIRFIISIYLLLLGVDCIILAFSKVGTRY